MVGEGGGTGGCPVPDVDGGGAGFCEGEGDAAGGSAGSEEEEGASCGFECGFVAQGGDEAGAVGVEAEQAAIAVDDGIDGAGSGGEPADFVEVGDDGFFVGDGDVRAEDVGGAEACDAGGELCAGGVPLFVGDVEAGMGEGCRLDDGGEGVRDGVADDAGSAGHGDP